MVSKKIWKGKNQKSPLYCHLQCLSISFGQKFGIQKEKITCRKKTFFCYTLPAFLHKVENRLRIGLCTTRRLSWKISLKGLEMAILQVKNFDGILRVVMRLKAFSLDRTDPFDEAWSATENFVTFSSPSNKASKKAIKIMSGRGGRAIHIWAE
jgi:hypothetical protein